MHRADGDLRAEQIGRSNLHARCAQGNGRRYALGVRNTASRYDRKPHRPDHLRQQRKRPNLGRQIIRQENSPVSTRFETLRDDDIDPMGFEPTRLLNRGGRRENLGSPSSNSRQQFCGGQTKMKAHHGGLEFAEHVRSVGIESRAYRGASMPFTSIPNSS